MSLTSAPVVALADGGVGCSGSTARGTFSLPATVLPWLGLISGTYPESGVYMTSCSSGDEYAKTGQYATSLEAGFI